MPQLPLDSATWTVRAVSQHDELPEALRDRDVPATVPGCVHLDLLAAGLIDDPYYDRNHHAQRWIGETDWQYRCTFSAGDELFAADHLELVCEGLDTVARLELNGNQIGEAEDMHIPYRFDVHETLKQGDNELVITFSSAVRYAEQQMARIGPLPFLNEDGGKFNFIRKNACNFGWDWGPALVTCGIWKPIYLHAWNTARIEYVRPLVTEATDRSATVAVHVDVAGDTSASKVAIRLFDPDGQPIADEKGASDQPATLTVDQPRRWWPIGYGEQPLYRVEVDLLDGDGGKLDTWSGRIGLRTVELEREPEEEGESFAIRVNGQRIWCKGANWIPDDHFLPRACTAERYQRRIDDALACGMNMLRVWGGGIFEDKAFYDYCDETGMLVWQDFLFACAAYSEEAPFYGLVEQEARHNVARLSPHASLVIWNGCNENLWFMQPGHQALWGKLQDTPDRTWGAGYYFDLLPKVCAEVDPTRPFWPGSPFSGREDLEAYPPNDDRWGNMHFWDVYFGGPAERYRNCRPRFNSEFGFQGPSTYATMAQYLPASQMHGKAEGWIAHQKSAWQSKDHNGEIRNQQRLEERFISPDKQDAFDDWLYVMQLNQARSVQLGVEWFRSLGSHCSGALYWNLNDTWPGTTWSCIDYEGRYKLLWYATRRFFGDRLVTIQPAGFESPILRLHAGNDSPQPWKTHAVIRRMDFQGHVLAEASVDIDVPQRTTTMVLELDSSLATPVDASKELVTVRTDDGRGNEYFFTLDKQTDYPEPKYQADLASQGDTHRLIVRAETVLRDLCLFAERIDPDAEVNDQMVTLLPGEQFTFEFKIGQSVDADALTQPPVLQCANRFGSKLLD